MASGLTDFSMLAVTTAAAVTTVVATVINYHFIRSQAYPEVVIYTELDEKRPSIIMLVIKNIGNGVAHNIRFYPPEPLPARAFGIDPNSAKQTFETISSGPIVDGIPSLPPGGSRMIDWGQYWGLTSAIGDKDFRIKIQYYAKKLWGEEMELVTNFSSVDIRSYKGTVAADRNPVKIESRDLEEIRRLLDSVIRGSHSLKIRREE